MELVPTTVTGFEGSLIKKLELPSTSLKTKRIRARERVVDVWKVHGSLDWFVGARWNDRIISVGSNNP